MCFVMVLYYVCIYVYFIIMHRQSQVNIHIYALAKISDPTPRLRQGAGNRGIWRLACSPVSASFCVRVAVWGVKDKYDCVKTGVLLKLKSTVLIYSSPPKSPLIPSQLSSTFWVSLHRKQELTHLLTESLGLFHAVESVVVEAHVKRVTVILVLNPLGLTINLRAMISFWAIL